MSEIITPGGTALIVLPSTDGRSTLLMVDSRLAKQPQTGAFAAIGLSSDNVRELIIELEKVEWP